MPVGEEAAGDVTAKAEQFLSLASRADVAKFLNISESRLVSSLYGRKERTNYRKFKIPKRGGGHRDISAPPPVLAFLQKQLVPVLMHVHAPKPASHGFEYDRSIVTNAMKHLGRQFVFNIDLSNFFPTIHYGRFNKLLQGPPFNIAAPAAMVLAQICFDDEGNLPQGAATSPVISNLICRPLDNAIQQLAAKHHCHYTRYADDMTFSTSRSTFPVPIGSHDAHSGSTVVGDELLGIISKQKFSVNASKTRLQTARKRQEVTGLSVNEIPNVRRSFVRELDSIIHCWRRHGYSAAYNRYLRKRGLNPHNQRSSPDGLRHILRGKLAFLSMVKGTNDPVCRRIQWALHDLSDELISKPATLAELKPALLSGFRGRFRDWKNIVRRYGESVLYVRVMAEEGCSSAATAFVIGPDVLATAGHVAKSGQLQIQMGEATLQPAEIQSVDVMRGGDYAVLKFTGRPFEKLHAFRAQYRLPEVGEEVAALGFPRIPDRNTTQVLHSGTIEALPIGYHRDRFLQTSFQSGGGLSGSPLLDKRGFVLGVMIENVYLGDESAPSRSEDRGLVPPRPYGQAMPFEYVARMRAEGQVRVEEGEEDRIEAETAIRIRADMSDRQAALWDAYKRTARGDGNLGRTDD